MGSLSVWHWLMFLAVALLMFGGSGKISSIMGDVAKGIKSFKKGMSEDEETAKKDEPRQGRALEVSRRRCGQARGAASGRRGQQGRLERQGLTSRRGLSGRLVRRRPAGRRSFARERHWVELMFDITSSKLLILGIVALLVIGPKDLPALLRTIGKYMGIIKRQAAEFRAQFDEAMRESELAAAQERRSRTSSRRPRPPCARPRPPSTSSSPKRARASMGRWSEPKPAADPMAMTRAYARRARRRTSCAECRASSTTAPILNGAAKPDERCGAERRSRETARRHAGEPGRAGEKTGA